MVASRSTVTRPPSAPGALPPARAQARSRAAERAARTAFSARGRSPARALTSRDTTESDATGPARSGCSRSTAISARQSPPSATAAARSATIFPGSWTARGARQRARFADKPRLRPVTRIVSHSRTAPAWATTPRPSADTVTRLPRALFFTWKVPSARVRTGLSTSPILPGQRHFFHLYRRPGPMPGESPRLMELARPSTSAMSRPACSGPVAAAARGDIAQHPRSLGSPGNGVSDAFSVSDEPHCTVWIGSRHCLR